MYTFHKQLSLHLHTTIVCLHSPLISLQHEQDLCSAVTVQVLCKDAAVSRFVFLCQTAAQSSWPACLQVASIMTHAVTFTWSLAIAKLTNKASNTSIHPCNSRVYAHHETVCHIVAASIVRLLCLLPEIRTRVAHSQNPEHLNGKSRIVQQLLKQLVVTYISQVSMCTNCVLEDKFTQVNS